MGVDGLYKFISVNCPYVYNSVFIKNINKKACIVDGVQHIYSQLIYMRTKNKEVYTYDVRAPKPEGEATVILCEN